MKYFERLVMAYINTIIPDTLDLLQFTYRPNRSTDDAISDVIYIALHIALFPPGQKEHQCENGVH